MKQRLKCRQQRHIQRDTFLLADGFQLFTEVGRQGKGNISTFK